MKTVKKTHNNNNIYFYCTPKSMYTKGCQALVLTSGALMFYQVCCGGVNYAGTERSKLAWKSTNWAWGTH